MWSSWSIKTYDGPNIVVIGTDLRIHDENGILTVQVYDRGVWSDVLSTPNPRLVVDRR